MLIGGDLRVLGEGDSCMCWRARGGDKERGRQGGSLESACSLRVVICSCCYVYWLVGGVALLLIGWRCGEQAKPQAAGEGPRASVALRVLVVNEPELAEAVNRLRGEWAERSGGELKASSMTWAQVASAKS